MVSLPVASSTFVLSKSMTLMTTALASALAAPSVLFCERSVSAPLVVLPPALMLRPSGMDASELETATVTPSAPATCTCPSGASAAVLPSVLEALLPAPPSLVAPCCLSAKALWLWTALLTPPPWSSFASLVAAGVSSPPAVLALARESA